MRNLTACVIVSAGDVIMSKRYQGILALLAATIIWGSTFIAQSVGMDYIGPFTFLTMRAVLAVPFLILLIFVIERNPAATLKKWCDPKLWKAGFICGISLFVAAGLQQVGIVHTTAGKAGFITAMYILLVPILGIFLGNRAPVTVWISVILAVIGLYFLSCVGVTQVNIGDLYLLGCAFAYAFQITLVDIYGPGLDGFRLNCVQTLFCGIFAAVFMFFTETPDMPNILDCWTSIAYAGILSTGIAFSLQIIGQKHVEPAPASLIMSLESVFAVLSGWLFLQERMSKYEITGCVLVFTAVILSQIPTKKSHE